MATASGLPKQVEEQAALAEEFMATLKGSQTEEDTSLTEEDDAAGPDDTEGGGREEEGSAEEEDELETADQNDTEDEEDPEESSFRRRYETLQGKYNAEVPRLNQELRELKDRIFEKLGDVTKKVDQPSEEKEDTDDGFAEELAEARERFGDDLLDFVEKMTERKAKQLLGESLTPVSQKVDSVESAQIQSAQAAFKQDLSSRVDGDWESLWSGDEGFRAFLATKEPNGFFTYGEVAKRANDNWDADVLSKIFNTYLQHQRPTEKVSSQVKERTKQERVTPRRNKVATEPEGNEARIWTQADIRQFQEDDRRGKIPQDQSKVLWDDLLRAPAENRIVN